MLCAALPGAVRAQSTVGYRNVCYARSASAALCQATVYSAMLCSVLLCQILRRTGAINGGRCFAVLCASLPDSPPSGAVDMSSASHSRT